MCKGTEGRDFWERPNAGTVTERGCSTPRQLHQSGESGSSGTWHVMVGMHARAVGDDHMGSTGLL